MVVWEASLAVIDIVLFASAIKVYYNSTNITDRQKAIQRILNLLDWNEHYRDKRTGRRVLSELPQFKYINELRTATILAQMNYDIVFAPAAMFQRDGKKFDIYLLRDTILLEADLKYISSQNPLTIANRIIGGAEQAPRVVLDISSPIDIKILIEGLRSGIYKSNLIREILLIYKKKLYRLPKNLISGKRIFDILKSDKGYT
jgi:hypothetical protein